jgi:hypothetical protein
MFKGIRFDNVQMGYSTIMFGYGKRQQKPITMNVARG